jgi:hypothetical protein
MVVNVRPKAPSPASNARQSQRPLGPALVARFGSGGTRVGTLIPAAVLVALGIAYLIVPPSQFGHLNPVTYALLILAGILVIGILPPLLMDRLRKPAWQAAGEQ